MSIGNADLDHDPVHHPSHYSSGGIECIDALREILSPAEFHGFVKGNAIKYLWRAGKKGPYVEDLEKARVYLNWTIEDATLPYDGPEEGDEDVPVETMPRLHFGEGGDVWVDGVHLPGVVLVEMGHTFEPSCGVDDDASVGSRHEASTDSPHRPAHAPSGRPPRGMAVIIEGGFEY